MSNQQSPIQSEEPDVCFAAFLPEQTDIGKTPYDANFEATSIENEHNAEYLRKLKRWCVLMPNNAAPQHAQRVTEKESTSGNTIMRSGAQLETSTDKTTGAPRPTIDTHFLTKKKHLLSDKAPSDNAAYSTEAPSVVVSCSHEKRQRRDKNPQQCPSGKNTTKYTAPSISITTNLLRN